MSWPWWTRDDQFTHRDRYLQQRAALFAHNRRLFAQREDWPDGFLALCERLDAEHPGWAVTWLPATPIPGRERPARWAAMIPEETRGLVSGLGRRRPWVYAATAAELVERIAEMDAQIEAAQAERDALWESVRRGARRGRS